MSLPVTSGLQLWYDASQLTGLTDGSNLTTFTDESGNANNAVYNAGTPAAYHTNQLNSLPAISFNTGARMLLTSSIAASSGFSAFAVWKLNSTAKGDFTGASLGGFKYWLATNQGLDSSNNVQVGTGTATLDTTNWHQSNVVYTNNSSALAFRLDGAADATQSLNVQNLTGSIQRFAIGVVDEEYFKGAIAEFIFYNRALSATEVGQLESYLYSKYGVGVPSSSVSIRRTRSPLGTRAGSRQRTH